MLPPRSRPQSRRACRQARRTPATVQAVPCVACVLQPACACSCGALRSDIGMKVAAIAGLGDETCADHEIAEALVRLALLRISRQQGIERRNDAFVLEIFGEQLG